MQGTSEQLARFLWLTNKLASDIDGDVTDELRPLGMPPELVNELDRLSDELGISKPRKPISISWLLPYDVRAAINELVRNGDHDAANRPFKSRCSSGSPYGDGIEAVLWTWIPEAPNGLVLACECAPPEQWEKFTSIARRNLREWHDHATFYRDMSRKVRVSVTTTFARPSEKDISTAVGKLQGLIQLIVPDSRGKVKFRPRHIIEELLKVGVKLPHAEWALLHLIERECLFAFTEVWGGVVYPGVEQQSVPSDVVRTANRTFSQGNFELIVTPKFWETNSAVKTPGNNGANGSQSNRGRKPKQASREEKRIKAAWDSGQYSTYNDVDRALALEDGKTKVTLDNLRKRDERRTK